MFRNYLEAFNTMNNLELLLCDEGHRIKNINGTKTSLALNNCCAMRRVVLTGTPIQNNLEELYTIINFIIPNYFGDIKEFRTNYISSITQAEDKRSTKEQQLEV